MSERQQQSIDSQNPRPVTAGPHRPRMLHHTAYVTHDAAATIDFYTRVLGMDLVSAVIDDEVPSTGDPWPYVHLFFELGDGSTVAFFEVLGLPAASAPSHPAYEVFNHLALDVGTREEVDLWAEKLRSHGVAFIGPTNHGIIYSIYFHDPNGIRLELTANLDNTWKSHAAKAVEDMRSWNEVKQKSLQAGGDLSAVQEWIRARRREHRKGASETP
jgi:catechol 2,3-dioxygenase-like lactoylglutathione lyase family enzyme